MAADTGLANIINALANMNLIVDWFPTIRTSPNKLDEVEAGSREEFYLLTTYVFVLAIKMEYLCKATQRFGIEGDPDIARHLKDDYQAILDPRDWRGRAYAAQAIMARLYGEIGKVHQDTLDQVAARKA
jgi:hypothetical protein